MIHVADTSLLIQIKDNFAKKPALLWDTLKSLESLVRTGAVTFPDQVLQELVDYNVPDSITAWCAGVKDYRHYTQPDYSTVRTILQNPVVSSVCDWNAVRGDPADPWVIAQAVELDELGVSVTVATEDWKDRLDGRGRIKKASMHTACAALGIPVIRTDAFLDEIKAILE